MIARKMPIAMQIRRLQEYIVAAGRDDVDIYSMIDRNLSYPENKELIRRYLQVSGKIRPKREYDQQYCDAMQNSCEIKCQKSACTSFKREQCPGEIEPCRSNVKRERVCPIIVRPYCVDPYSYNRAKDGKKISVKGHCQGETRRRCR